LVKKTREIRQDDLLAQRHRAPIQKKRAPPRALKEEFGRGGIGNRTDRHIDKRKSKTEVWLGTLAAEVNERLFVRVADTPGTMSLTP